MRQSPTVVLVQHEHWVLYCTIPYGSTSNAILYCTFAAQLTASLSTGTLVLYSIGSSTYWTVLWLPRLFYGYLTNRQTNGQNWRFRTVSTVASTVQYIIILLRGMTAEMPAVLQYCILYCMTNHQSPITRIPVAFLCIVRYRNFARKCETLDSDAVHYGTRTGMNSTGRRHNIMIALRSY